MPLKGEAKKKYQLEWMRQRRQKGIQYLGGKCVSCSSDKDLEFDHKNPETKWSHRFWSYSWERIITELGKCQLLCISCHKVKSAREHPKGEAHLSAKLTEEQAGYIKTSKEPSRILADRFNINIRTVQQIRKGDRWNMLS